jgi:hypothetical protein
MRIPGGVRRFYHPAVSGELHFQRPVDIALPLALLLDHLPTQRMIFQPVFRQRQRQFSSSPPVKWPAADRRDGGWQTESPDAAADTDARQRAAVRRFADEGGEIDGVGLVQQQRCQQLFLRRRKPGRSRLRTR